LGGYYGYAGGNWGVFQNPYGGSAMTASSGGSSPGGGYSGGGSSAVSGESASYAGQAVAYPTSGLADGSVAQAPSLTTRKGLASLFDGESNLDWPLGLRILPPAEETAALRQEVENFFRASQEGRGRGKAPAVALNEAGLAVARLQRLLARHADQLPVSPYTIAEAKRYLRRLKRFAMGLE
jgi:hypothetical protein